MKTLPLSQGPSLRPLSSPFSASRRKVLSLSEAGPASTLASLRCQHPPSFSTGSCCVCRAPRALRSSLLSSPPQPSSS